MGKSWTQSKSVTGRIFDLAPSSQRCEAAHECSVCYGCRSPNLHKIPLTGTDPFTMFSGFPLQVPSARCSASCVNGAFVKASLRCSVCSIAGNNLALCFQTGGAVRVTWRCRTRRGGAAGAGRAASCWGATSPAPPAAAPSGAAGATPPASARSAPATAPVSASGCKVLCEVQLPGDGTQVGSDPIQDPQHTGLCPEYRSTESAVCHDVFLLSVLNRNQCSGQDLEVRVLQEVNSEKMWSKCGNVLMLTS